MLSLMRKHATNWMIKFIIGAITVVFVFWGVGSFRDRDQNQVATVNEDSITLDEYRFTYNNILDQMRANFGDNLNDDILKMFNVKQQAMNQLIDKKLLLQEARKLGLRVTDDELTEAIANIPAFQNGGSFDSRLYANLLNRNRLSPEQFEASQRDAMLSEKLRAFVTAGTKVSEHEAQQWYQWQNGEVDIDFVQFAPDIYKEIKVTEDEIKTYFEANKNNYKTDPQVKARYLHFNPELYSDEVTVTPEAVEQYYAGNPEEFKTEKQVEARHILLRVAEDADQEIVDAKLKSAKDIEALARSGKDFAELAKEFSEGPTKESGGFLGAFAKNAMVKPFADTAFAMKAGEISEPVKTRFGWHIIKVERIIPESVTPQKEAETQIRAKLIAEKTKNLAYDDAEAIQDVAFQEDDLVQAASEQDLELVTTAFFSRSGPVLPDQPVASENSGSETDKKKPAKAPLQDPAQFAEAAFKLENMEISDIQELSDGYFLIQTIAKQDAQIPALETVKDKVEADLLKEKQDQKANEVATTFLKSVRDKGDWAATVKTQNLTAQTTGWFKRGSSIPNIGYENEIATAAFNLSKTDLFPQEALKGAKGYYVIAFKDRKAPEVAGFDSEKEQITQTLLGQKQRQAFQNWLEMLKEDSEIRIEPGFLE